MQEVIEVFMDQFAFIVSWFGPCVNVFRGTAGHQDEGHQEGEGGKHVRDCGCRRQLPWLPPPSSFQLSFAKPQR